jgi:divalent metal cation (Fe/Co/Zn/Cd) transporter
MATTVARERARVVRRGQRLTTVTLLYNSLEGITALALGILAGSVALVGFGVDSFIEVLATVAAMWRLHQDADADRRAKAERHALLLIGLSFLGLATYVGVDAGRTLITRATPERSPLGIALAIASLIVMPVLARAKRQVAAQLSSTALRAEARQTDICMYLSAILLGGLGLNTLAGWWWADPVAALVMVPLIAWEGRETLRGRRACADCAPTAAA